MILGLDQSITQTGWCLYAGGDERRMRCGSFSCSREKDAEAQCDLFGRHLKYLIGRHKPSFICWERASRKISAYPKRPPVDMIATDADTAGFWTVNPGQLLLPELQGIIRCAAILYRIPYESVPVGTWRAAIFGKGAGIWKTAKAKAEAKAYCRRLGIAFDNENEAEAACIARWAATCSQRFKLLRFSAEAAA